MFELDETAAFFWRIDDSGLKSLQESDANIFTPYVQRNRWLFETKPALNMLCQKRSCRRGRLETT